MARHTFPRDFYYPVDATPVDCGDSDAAVFTYEKNGTLFAIGFHGKASKPDWHYRFRGEEQRQRRIAEHIEARKARAEYMNKRKAERSKPHTLKKGDILRSSWGYEQTNIDFYQVTKLCGEHMVEIRPIAQNATETGWCQGTCSPRKNAFIGEPMRKKVDGELNAVRIASYASAFLWKGGESHWTSYH